MSTPTLQHAMVAVLGAVAALPVSAADVLPFSESVEVYRGEEGDVQVFRLRLEQPFLAEEFEQSNYLRLTSSDERAYLIYPKETKFQQKHAEFFGRLRGEGKVSLTLSYEIVSENPDGSRRVEIREGEVKVDVPTEPVGSDRIYRQWAQQQNLHFAHLLRYYPEETFFQYCLLQSKARYGVEPEPFQKGMPDEQALEADLYRVLTGSLAIQQALQRQALSGPAPMGDLNTHISKLQPPNLRSLPYDDLLEEKRTRDGVEPKLHDAAVLVPGDYYFLHFNSLDSLGELLDLTTQWGDSLLRLATVRAQDSQVRAKLEDQLCVRWDPLTDLFASGVLRDVTVTGADPFLLEGADVTVLLAMEQPEAFEKAAAGWVDEVRQRYPDLVSREFNYRGHQVTVHYTNDRVVSSFTARHNDYLVYSNSHRAIREVIDVALGVSPSLHESLDYRYVTTLLAPSDDARSGYLFVPEAAIRRLIGPAAKISEKRRIQCFNNLVMLNNASLFFRMEYGRSPRSLSELIEQRFIDPRQIVCPHGGSYAFDVEHDMCTCSLHNRLRYLTPNVELSVLNVSAQEAAEYERYKQRYQAFWQTVFDPVAIRFTVGPQVKLETCVLPFANGSLYRDLRDALDRNPQSIGTERISRSAVLSLVMVPGRENIGRHLNQIPGVAEVLRADPTLTDLQWVGDRVGVHFCDGETILQIDPAALSPKQVPIVGKVPVSVQASVSALVAAANLPVYLTVDVENRDRAARLLEQLSQQVFLRHADVMPGLSTRLDAYRQPDYKDHAVYVFTGQLYALKIRFHAALVGNQLVAATRPEVLRDVIDASTKEPENPPVEAHLLVRFNRRGIHRLHDDLQLYWAEKSRVACHRNIISIYNLCKLYDIPISEVPSLSEAKYGVRYFCPDHGEYRFDTERDQVVCGVHGNRELSQQNPHPDRKSSFTEFIESIEEVVAYLRFQDDSLIATLEIARSVEGGAE